MAARPWVTPQQVKEYTDHKEVAERADEKLLLDIARAEAKVIKLTHNRFEDDKYPELPPSVALATILITEAYAKNAVLKTKKQLKSETFDDYAYTVESGEISLDNLDLDELLNDFIVPEDCGSITMRLRKL